jgi:hypothetical protein
MTLTLVLISNSLKVIFFLEKSELLRSNPFFKNFPIERWITYSRNLLTGQKLIRLVILYVYYYYRKKW